MYKKILKKIFVILIIMILGGLGGIIADRYLFPYLCATNFFKKYDFLKKASDNVTVINKTEQVYVKEETSIAKISNQASSSVVSIISYPKTDSAIPSKKTPAAAETQYKTGVIVTSDGLIMTYSSDLNYDNFKYKVITFDGKNYDVDVEGMDSYGNLLFLKISASNLPAISFGNSDEIKPGEKVIEIGVSPGNSEHEYSTGLVSNFDPFYNLAGKAVSSSEKLEGVFKGDLSQQKDYIGGPAVDYNGQAIGIIGSVTKDNVQIFFQIPGNKVKKIIDRAIKKELDQSPVLGIYYIPINESYALVNNLSVNKGALIYSASGQSGLAIIAGSSAQKAGLQINDIVAKINGQEINPDNTLSDLLYQHKKGDQIELDILRDGKELKLTAQV